MTVQKWRYRSLWVLLLWGTLLWLSAPLTLTDGDAGEFATLAFTGGIAHPPGYPLFCLLLRGLAWCQSVFGGSPISWLVLLSMCSTLCAGWLLADVLRRWGVDFWPAWCAVLVAGGATPLWRNATTIEPFALNLALAAAVIWLSAGLSDDTTKQGARLSPLGLGFCFALGFCNHHSLVMLAPGSLLLLIVAGGGALGFLRRSGYFALGFVAGLWPLGYFAFAHETNAPVLWGDWSQGWQQLWRHLLRMDYGSLQLSVGAEGSWWSSIGLWLRAVPHDLSWIFALLGVWGLLLLLLPRWRASKYGPEPLQGIALIMHFCCASFLFFGLSRMHAEGLGQMILERFFALPLLCLVPCLGLAIQSLSQRLFTAQPWGRWALAFVLLFHLGYQFPRAERRTEQIAAQYTYNVFRSVPRNAILITSADPDYLSLLYGRYVRFAALSRAIVIQSGLWHLPWYRQQIQRQLRRGKSAAQQKWPIRPKLSATLHLWRKSRPVFLTSPTLDGPLHPSLRTVPLGPLLQVIPSKERPTLSLLLVQNSTLMQKLFQLPTKEAVKDANAWESFYLMQYTRNWGMLMQAFQRRRALRSARFCRRQIDRLLSPWIKKWME